jgi:hypothetical protein
MKINEDNFSVVAFVSGVSLIAVLIASHLRSIERQDVRATVEEVRVIFEKGEELKNGHPVAGAVVGGLIAQTPGAIVGAAIGDSGYSKTEVTKLLGCNVIVRTSEDKVMPLRFDKFNYLAPQAALLHKGDVIHLTLTVEKKTGEIKDWTWNADRF